MPTLIHERARRARLTTGTAAGGQRAHVRHRLVLQVAKLATAHGEELCILRDVSAGGLQAVVYGKFMIGEQVRFELRTGRGMAGQVVWTSGSVIGVAFDYRVPILAFLAHQAIEEMGRQPRPPRVRIGEPGVVRVDDRAFPADIIDASQAGLRVRASQILPTGETCRILADGLGDRVAVVRWRGSGKIGLQFRQPLSFRDFARWRTHGLRTRTVN